MDRETPRGPREHHSSDGSPTESEYRALTENERSTLLRLCKLACFVIKYFVTSGSKTHHAPDSEVLPSSIVHLSLIQRKDRLKKDEMDNKFSDLTLMPFYIPF